MKSSWTHQLSFPGRRLQRAALLLAGGLLTSVSAVAGYQLGPITDIVAYPSGGPTPSELRAADGVLVWETQLSSNRISVNAFDSLNSAVIELRNNSNRRYLQPDVSGRTIVWSEDEGSSRNIYRYDLDTQAVTPVTTGASHLKTYPSISGGLIAWDQFPPNGTGPDRDLFALALPATTPTPVRADPGYQGAPDVDGGLIAFGDGNTSTLVIYDWNAQQVFKTINSPVYSPDRIALSGDWVAWKTPTSIRAQNILTDQVIDVPAGPTLFTMDEGRLVFYDWQSKQIKLTDLTTGLTDVLHDVPIDVASRGPIALDGDTLYWAEQTAYAQFTNDPFTIRSAVLVPEPATLAMLPLAGGW